MRYGSVCSGIEAASVAWEPLGWEPAWFSEIEKFPSAVLAHHWPEVENLGDMLELVGKTEDGEIEAPDVLVGGTPCQAFSVAGRRGSLEDDRGALTLAYIELLNRIDERRKEHGKEPCICVWENVPGVLNTKDNAFGCFLAGLAGESEPLHPSGERWTNAGCVYGPERTVAWRVLDAQYFGLAQRRKRVFVVASARDGFDPTKVLFESKGVRRDTAPSREAREEAAVEVGTSFTASSFGQYSEGVGTLRAAGGDLGGGSETLVTGFRKLTFESYAQDETSSNMKVRDYKDATDLVGQMPQFVSLRGSDGGATAELGGPIAGTLRAATGGGSKPHVLQSMCVHGTQDPCVANNVAHTLGRNNGQENAIYSTTGAGYWNEGVGPLRGREQDSHELLNVVHAVAPMRCPAIGWSEELTASIELQGTIQRGGDGGRHEGVMQPDMAVRRLTPVECERLQGFPDGHTRIPWRGKGPENCPDGHRYKALGNSMAVPVIQWIGARIASVVSRKQKDCDESVAKSR